MRVGTKMARRGVLDLCALRTSSKRLISAVSTLYSSSSPDRCKIVCDSTLRSRRCEAVFVYYDVLNLLDQSKSPNPLSESSLINSIMPCEYFKHMNHLEQSNYLRHQRSAILVPHIAEGHLCAFMFIDLDLWIIDIWYVLEFNYTSLVKNKGMSGFSILTFPLHDHPRYSDCSICGHLDGP